MHIEILQGLGRLIMSLMHYSLGLGTAGNISSGPTGRVPHNYIRSLLSKYYPSDVVFLWRVM